MGLCKFRVWNILSTTGIRQENAFGKSTGANTWFYSCLWKRTIADYYRQISMLVKFLAFCRTPWQVYSKEKTSIYLIQQQYESTCWLSQLFKNLMRIYLLFSLTWSVFQRQTNRLWKPMVKHSVLAQAIPFVKCRPFAQQKPKNWRISFSLRFWLAFTAVQLPVARQFPRNHMI